MKNGNLEVFNDSGEESPEMSVGLSGCDIQSAKDNKRQLAIRLLKDGKELVILDVSDPPLPAEWGLIPFGASTVRNRNVKLKTKSVCHKKDGRGRICSSGLWALPEPALGST